MRRPTEQITINISFQNPVLSMLFLSPNDSAYIYILSYCKTRCWFDVKSCMTHDISPKDGGSQYRLGFFMWLNAANIVYLLNVISLLMEGLQIIKLRKTSIFYLIYVGLKTKLISEIKRKARNEEQHDNKLITTVNFCVK